MDKTKRPPAPKTQKWYHSIDELVADSESNGRNEQLNDHWSGGTFEDAAALAATGWETELPATLDIVTSVVSDIERESMVVTFNTVYGTDGADVDVARFLTGEPECMISYPLVSTPRDGKVIALCASVCYSASVEPEQITQRGQAISALAFALSQLGMSVELWADVSIYDHCAIKCQIKSANDTLDTAKVMFAYAHTAFYRQLMFGSSTFKHGAPVDPAQDLPEGTIYLPATYTDGIEDMGAWVTNELKTLGLI